MGQKTRPTGFRIGITEPWRSRWYATKKEFGDLLVEDKKLRDHVKSKNKAAGIARPLGRAGEIAQPLGRAGEIARCLGRMGEIARRL